MVNAFWPRALGAMPDGRPESMIWRAVQRDCPPNVRKRGKNSA
jgi:hypothetical protein